MSQPVSAVRAGAASVDITPDRPLLLEGYGNRRGPAVGTLDRLEAGAVILDDGRTRAAIVSLDLCGIQASSVRHARQLAAASTGIPADNIVVVYSHSHSAPLATPYLGETPDAEYLRWMEGRVAEAIELAAAQLRPVRLGVGEGRIGFNVNRRTRTADGTLMRANPRGQVDQRVRVLRLDPADAPEPPGTLGGRPLPQADPVALLFSAVCHATMLRAENYHYSGDYPGVARRYVEGAFSDGGAAPTSDPRRDGPFAPPPHLVPTTHALFLTGCGGNVRPHLLAPDGGWRSANRHELTVMGRQLGAEVVRVAETIASEPVDRIAVARAEVELPYQRLPSVEEIRAALDGPRAYWAKAMLVILERDGRLPESERTEVQVLRLGRHWIVALPGETLLEIGLSIERGLAEMGLAVPERGDAVVTIGYANDYVAYLCSASIMTEGGYEPTSAHEYLRCGPFAPTIEPILVGTALRLAVTL